MNYKGHTPQTYDELHPKLLRQITVYVSAFEKKIPAIINS